MFAMSELRSGRGERGNGMLGDCVPHFVDSLDIAICETAFESVGVSRNVVLTVTATKRPSRAHCQ